MWLAAGSEALGLSPAGVAPLVTVGCAGLLLWRISALLAHRGPWALAVGLGSLTLSPAVACWSSSGMETMAYTLLVYLGWERCLHRQRAGTDWVAGGVLLGLVLIRAEGFAWVAVWLGLAVLLRPDRGRPLWAPAGVALLALAAHFGWRLATYGAWLPLTVTAKVDHLPLFVRGLRYLAPACWSWSRWRPWPRFPVRGRRRPVGPGAAAFALGWPVLAGGDFAAFSRLLLPALPLLAVVLGEAAARSALLRAVGVGAALLGALAATGVEPPRAAGRARPGPARPAPPPSGASYRGSATGWS